LIAFGAVVCSAAILAAQSGVVLNEPLAGRQVFPTTNWWNQDVSTAPLDPSSAAIINWISGRTGGNTTAVRRLHPDFGPPPYGFPYIVVPSSQKAIQAPPARRPVIRFLPKRKRSRTTSKATCRAAVRMATDTC
jgi:hypothetical protein